MKHHARLFAVLRYVAGHLDERLLKRVARVVRRGKVGEECKFRGERDRWLIRSFALRLGCRSCCSVAVALHFHAGKGLCGGCEGGGRVAQLVAQVELSRLLRETSLSRLRE
jgi:hypothetical protein